MLSSPTVLRIKRLTAALRPSLSPLKLPSVAVLISQAHVIDTNCTFESAMALRMASLSSADSAELITYVLTDEWCALAGLL